MKTLALAAVVALVLSPSLVRGQGLPTPHRTQAPLLTTNRTLLASLERISKGSPLWREGMAGVRKTGRSAVILTPADVKTRGGKGSDHYAFDEGAVAETFPLFDGNSRIVAAVVVVNLGLIRGMHDARLSVLRDFEADLDRILVHEVYGHAVPYLLTGDMTGRCTDPREGENASDACSIRRENAVRAELGLGRRADSGLHSLALLMARR
jgi:hypothetical protein